MYKCVVCVPVMYGSKGPYMCRARLGLCQCISMTNRMTRIFMPLVLYKG